MFRVIGRLALCVLLLSGLGMAAAEDESMSLGAVRRLAEQGDASAQYSLGARYDFGEGVPEHDAEAVKWYRLAAEQGHAEAQYNLGIMYANGEGVPQDDTEAMKWFRLAAEQGDAEAMKWLRLAAEQGDAEAQYKPGGHVCQRRGRAAGRRRSREMVPLGCQAGRRRSAIQPGGHV